MKKERKEIEDGRADGFLILGGGKQQSTRKYSSGEATARTRHESRVQKERRAALGGDKSVFGGSRARKDWLKRMVARERSNIQDQRRFDGS